MLPGSFEPEGVPHLPRRQMAPGGYARIPAERPRFRQLLRGIMEQRRPTLRNLPGPAGGSAGTRQPGRADARFHPGSAGFHQGKPKFPFFLYLAHAMPHYPVHASDAFRGKSEAGLYGDAAEEIDWSVGEIIEHAGGIGTGRKDTGDFQQRQRSLDARQPRIFTRQETIMLRWRIPGAIHRPVAGGHPGGKEQRRDGH